VATTTTILVEGLVRMSKSQIEQTKRGEERAIRKVKKLRRRIRALQNLLECRRKR
jgi:hypothetical protein